MYEVTRRKMLKMAAAAALSNYRILDPHVHVWKHDARMNGVTPPWTEEAQQQQKAAEKPKP